jgi:hypothetical protein
MWECLQPSRISDASLSDKAAIAAFARKKGRKPRYGRTRPITTPIDRNDEGKQRKFGVWLELGSSLRSHARLSARYLAAIVCHRRYPAREDGG